MKFTGFLFASLKIESSSNKWASRLLFIVIFAFSVMMRISPPGDPDLTGIVDWLDEVEAMTGAQISQLSLPEITKGNIVYLAASFVVAILFVIFLFVSIYIYFGDHAEDKKKYTLLGFLRRLPSLLAFVFLLLIPVNFLAQCPIFIILSLFIISAVYLSPAIIINEKVSSLEAVLKSVKKTYGFKFSIFMNVLTIYSIYQVIIWIFSKIVNESSVGFSLIDGFLFAFLIVSIGKNIGAFYKITSEIPQAI
jgi:hypothetical protein